MSKSSKELTRDERYRELLGMFRERRTREHVVSLFHRARSGSRDELAGISIFDVILDEEFGPRSGDAGNDSSQL
jgi:hypothetical protein